MSSDAAAARDGEEPEEGDVVAPHRGAGVRTCLCLRRGLADSPERGHRGPVEPASLAEPDPAQSDRRGSRGVARGAPPAQGVERIGPGHRVSDRSAKRSAAPIMTSARAANYRVRRRRAMACSTSPTTMTTAIPTKATQERSGAPSTTSAAATQRNATSQDR